MRYRDVPRLSGAANAAIRSVEARHFAPGMVATSVNVWSAHVHGSHRRWKQWEAEFTCTCCGGEWARETLERAIALLPPHAAGEVRDVVRGLDEALLSRTHHDPQTSPDLPWWLRRC